MNKFNGYDEILAHVGTELGVTDWHEVTQKAIDTFAEIPGEPQWIHVDPERAAATPFGGTVAHGLYTLSLGPGFCTQLFALDGFTLGMNYGYDKVRFPAVLPVGERVRMRATLAAAEAVDGGCRVTITGTFERENDPKPVCVANMIFRLFE
jgi:acyl dehydratase